MDKFSKFIKYKLYEAGETATATSPKELKCFNNLKNKVIDFKKKVTDKKSPEGEKKVSEQKTGVKLQIKTNFYIKDYSGEEYTFNYFNILNDVSGKVPLYHIKTNDADINNKQTFIFADGQNFNNIKKTFQLLKGLRKSIAESTINILSFSKFKLLEENEPVNSTINKNMPVKKITQQEFDDKSLYNFLSYSNQLGQDFETVKSCMTFLQANYPNIYKGSYSNFSKFENLLQPTDKKKDILCWKLKRLEKTNSGKEIFNILNAGDILNVGETIQICKINENTGVQVKIEVIKLVQNAPTI